MAMPNLNDPKVRANWYKSHGKDPLVEAIKEVTEQFNEAEASVPKKFDITTLIGVSDKGAGLLKTAGIDTKEGLEEIFKLSEEEYTNRLKNMGFSSVTVSQMKKNFIN